MLMFVFFFKQKTAYEGRISDWSSDVCSSDLLLRFVDLTTVHIGRARELSLADGMRAVVETPRGNPLVAVGEVGGHRVGLIGFDLRSEERRFGKWGVSTC